MMSLYAYFSFLYQASVNNAIVWKSMLQKDYCHDTLVINLKPFFKYLCFRNFNTNNGFTTLYILIN